MSLPMDLIVTTPMRYFGLKKVVLRSVDESVAPKVASQQCHHETAAKQRLTETLAACAFPTDTDFACI
jgi:hypothetical protein